MRRLLGVLAFSVLGLLLSPPPADAWWEWLDELSGPKGLKGLQFEGRLLCFGDQAPTGLRETLNTAYAEAIRATAVASWSQAGAEVLGKPDPSNRQAWQKAVDDWRLADAKWAKAEEEWAELAIAVNALSAQDVEKMRRIAEEARGKAETEERNLPAKSNFEEVVKLWRTAVDDRQSTKRATQSVFMSRAAVGVFWSACSPTKMRRVSLDAGISFLRTGDARFADSDHQLKLTMLIPSFSWNVLPDPRYDVVDVGIGGGVYWFSSSRMESLSGVVLQPWRVDIHAPSSWAGKPMDSPKRWAAVPVLRVGQLLFPGGFAPNAFNSAPGFSQSQLPSELVRAVSIFINVEPFIRRSPM